MSSSIKKILVVFEQEGCQLFSKMMNSRVLVHGQEKKLLDRKPHSVVNNMEQYHREGLYKLINNLFVKNRNVFDVGVWSSQNRETTQLFTKNVFGRHNRNLLFVSATRIETLKSQVEINREAMSQISSFPIERNLGGVFEKFNQYSPANTVVISPFQNLMEAYAENDILLKYYSPQAQGYKFIADFDLVVLSNYIETLKDQIEKKKCEDLRPFLSSLRLSYATQRYTEHVHEFGNV